MKLAIQKAFDRMEWSFIEDTLSSLGLPSWVINLIHHCINASQIAINWNGCPPTSFCPTRGLRPGDLLSPYSLCSIWNIFHTSSKNLSKITNDSLLLLEGETFFISPIYSLLMTSSLSIKLLSSKLKK